MFNIGPQELLLILLVALVIVGPKRLPEITRTLGRGLREFRKAQDEVTKTIRLGLDDTEPTTKPAPRGSGASPTPETGTAPPAGPEDGGEGAAPTEPDEAADIARTLGRGLAEIRRARQEVQRTFRVDLSDEPPQPRPAGPPAAGTEPRTEPSAPDSSASEGTPDARTAG